MRRDERGRCSLLLVVRREPDGAGTRARRARPSPSLFSDVTGSTELGERLDPEALRELMNRYFDAARGCRHHGGTVEKFIGDAVMAVFGIPMPTRTTPCARAGGAEMREALDAERRARGRTGVRCTCGSGSTRARSSPATARAHVVTGDAVNVATRLEQAPATGRSCSATRHTAGPRRAVRPSRRAARAQGQGRAGAGLAAARRPRRTSRPSSAPIATPLVGRRRELKALSSRVRAR